MAVAEHLLESFKARYPFPLDEFQLRAIAASGAKSEIDEAIAQAAIDALFKK